MARIPKDELERLKRETDLVELVRAAGVELKAARQGPARAVSVSRRQGAVAGRHSGEEPVELPRRLRRGRNGGRLGDADAGGELPARGGDPAKRQRGVCGAGAPLKRSTVPRLPCPLSDDAEGAGAARPGGRLLPRDPARLAGGEGVPARSGASGITEAVERFKLGFANRTLGLRLPEKNRAAGARLRERLVETGLFRTSGHEHFNGSLVIPGPRRRGQGGRGLRPQDHREACGRARRSTSTCPGPHRGVWNLDALRSSKEIILCEALIDALTFWCAGYRNVTSAYGTNGFTAEMLEAFKAYGVERVLIAL